jgi:hypothetical protein
MMEKMINALCTISAYERIKAYSADPNKKVFIRGAGKNGKIIAAEMKRLGIRIDAFIDKKAASENLVIEGIPTVTPEMVYASPTDSYYVIVSVASAADYMAIQDEMQAHGLKALEDFVDFGISSDRVARSRPLDIARTTPPPPNTIPAPLFNDYTMNGEIPVLYKYFQDDISEPNQGICNTAERYEKVFRGLENKTFKYYGTAQNYFYKAFESYSLKGKTVMIWGLQGCNCEAMALWQGAERVYVIDYNKPVCEHGQITVMNHEELGESGIKADVAISYSSFEHDGLGRYGDPLNPNGDLQAMQAAYNYLKDGGFLWLGVPCGLDCLVWNAHRIYGEKRLTLLLKGWETKDVFEQKPSQGLPLGEYTQPLMILRKQPAFI